MPENFFREAKWERWKGSVESLAAFARLASDLASTYGSFELWISLKTERREVDYHAVDHFEQDVKRSEFGRPFRSLSINTIPPVNDPAASYVHFYVGGPYAASLRVEGQNRSNVEGVFAELCEKADEGKRRPNVRPVALRRITRLVGVLFVALLVAGVALAAGPPTSPAAVAAVAAGGVLLAVAAAAIGGYAVQRLVPWLEFLEPGEQTAWESFRSRSLSWGERILWLAIGALVVWLVGKL